MSLWFCVEYDFDFKWLPQSWNLSLKTSSILPWLMSVTISDNHCIIPWQMGNLSEDLLGHTFRVTDKGNYIWSPKNHTTRLQISFCLRLTAAAAAAAVPFFLQYKKPLSDSDSKRSGAVRGGERTRADRESQVRQCLGCCTAYFWSSLAYESAEQKPKLETYYQLNSDWTEKALNGIASFYAPPFLFLSQMISSVKS